MITLCLATTGCHEEKAAAETADVRVENGQIAVEVGSPSEGSISVETSRSPKEATLSLNGRITWDDTVTTRIFTPLGGRVSKINVANGQTVQRGDTLALITSPDYGQALADAQKAASNFNLKERTLGRVTELNAHGAAPLKDVQSAQADYEQSRSEKTRCEAKLSLYGDGKFGGSEYALKSLLDGVVVEKNINPGQELRPDQMLANVPQLAAPLFVVTDPTHLWVQIDLAERDADGIHVGQNFFVQSSSVPNKKFAGQVELISDALDPATRTVKVRGSISNPNRQLKAEMFVKAEFKLETTLGAEVPAGAVFLRGEKHCVLVETTPGHYARREVTVGSEHEGRIVIRDGLEAGQRVVVNGLLLLEGILNEESKS